MNSRRMFFRLLPTHSNALSLRQLVPLLNDEIKQNQCNFEQDKAWVSYRSIALQHSSQVRKVCSVWLDNACSCEAYVNENVRACGQSHKAIREEEENIDRPRTECLRSFENIAKLIYPLGASISDVRN